MKNAVVCVVRVHDVPADELISRLTGLGYGTTLRSTDKSTDSIAIVSEEFGYGRHVVLVVSPPTDTRGRKAVTAALFVRGPGAYHLVSVSNYGTMGDVAGFVDSALDDGFGLIASLTNVADTWYDHDEATTTSRS